jgi:hypothetical protein
VVSIDKLQLLTGLTFQILIATAEKINFIFIQSREAAMTDPITGISSTMEPGKKNSVDRFRKHEKNPGQVDENEEDSVDISEEARERAAGRKRKNILDYLNEISGKP